MSKDVLVYVCKLHLPQNTQSGKHRERLDVFSYLEQMYLTQIIPSISIGG